MTRSPVYALADVDTHLWVLAFLLGVQLFVLALAGSTLREAAEAPDMLFVFGPAPDVEPEEAALEARRRKWLHERPGDPLPPELQVPPGE